uniref:Ig-like domain-containing protein n=1 Tax=Urocitellus parryii TaxID=9999 RepID=A0A8D2HJ70_UROPR
MQRGLGALLGLLWVQLCWVRGQQVEQSPSALRLQEGTSSTLRCNFSTSMDRVQWFLQKPDGGLISLFYLTSGTKQEGRLKGVLNFQERYSTLNISTSQLEDSGTYLCAARHSAPWGPAACLQTSAAPAPTACASEKTCTVASAQLWVSCFMS